MSDPASLTPGIYEHYKGKLYLALGAARHSETGEPLAIYRPLYGDYRMFARPLAMFAGTVKHDGQTLPRFRLVRDLAGT